MTQPTHVDGNAVGGLLREVFGAEMTHRLGCCGNCGNVGAMATLIVYRQAPGDVVRCPACGTVLMVLVTTPAGVRLGLGSLRWLEVAGGD